MLTNATKRAKPSKTSRKHIHHIELETNPNFFDHFVEGCSIGNKKGANIVDERKQNISNRRGDPRGRPSLSRSPSTRRTDAGSAKRPQGMTEFAH